MPRLEPGMARIRVKDLRLRTFIGIKEEEILNKQDVLINLTILYPAQEAVELYRALAEAGRQPHRLPPYRESGRRLPRPGRDRPRRWHPHPSADRRSGVALPRRRAPAARHRVGDADRRVGTDG